MVVTVTLHHFAQSYLSALPNEPFNTLCQRVQVRTAAAMESGDCCLPVSDSHSGPIEVAHAKHSDGVAAPSTHRFDVIPRTI
jgi:hypothetical protein